MARPHIGTKVQLLHQTNVLIVICLITMEVGAHAVACLVICGAASRLAFSTSLSGAGQHQSQ